jgi:choline dehydrogenase
VQQEAKELFNMYDYIIVGAGSAGCVLANRLSEDPSVSVLLLEAGPADEHEAIQIPLVFSQLFKTPFDWAFFTEEEPHAGNRKLYWPRGRVWGGSSSLNAMIYIRGNRYDYDSWAAGCEGWDYNSVLEYFKRAEHNETLNSEYHGTEGPLNVANQRSASPVSQAFVEAGVELGYPRNPDFNGETQEGFGMYQVTQKNGTRFSTASAYLRPALSRPNLTVESQALTNRVLFEGNRAIGVEYVQNSETKQALARQEVILSAGAVNSPQILLLSGVGPAAHLQEMGIGVVADVPGVGQNLQDHPAIMVIYEMSQPLSLINGATEEAMAQFMGSQDGPLTSNVGEGGAFLKIDPNAPAPDMQYHFAPSYFVEHGFKNPEGHGLTIGPTLLAPESRGYIKLRSTDPAAPPVIQANYYASEKDVRTMVEAVKLARQLAKTSALAPYTGAEVFPGEAAQTDDDLAHYVRTLSETLYHPTGTCKMGVDDMAVVDPELKVRGVEGLRVVDASIMPTVTRGNTNAPTIMIGEKAADLIKASRSATETASTAAVALA